MMRRFFDPFRNSSISWVFIDFKKFSKKRDFLVIKKMSWLDFLLYLIKRFFKALKEG